MSCLVYLSDWDYQKKWPKLKSTFLKPIHVHPSVCLSIYLPRSMKSFSCVWCGWTLYNNVIDGIESRRVGLVSHVLCRRIAFATWWGVSQMRSSTLSCGPPRIVQESTLIHQQLLSSRVEREQLKDYWKLTIWSTQTEGRRPRPMSISWNHPITWIVVHTGG